jgi:hypothetical protein
MNLSNRVGLWISGAVVGLTLCLGIALLFSGRLFRESVNYSWTIPFCDGGDAEVEAVYSNTSELALAPSIVFGGGSPKHELRIKVDGDHYRWSGQLEPIVLERNSGNLQLVLWDRRPWITKDEFLFYVYHDKAWHRIDRKEFEPRLAVRNLDWYREYSTIMLRTRLTNEDYVSSVDFRCSATAHLWSYLSGRESGPRFAALDESFLREFCESEIKRSHEK